MSSWLDRAFVDRHVYERRARGGQVVTFTRRAQLGMASAVTGLVLLTAGLGASTVYLWVSRQASLPEPAGVRQIGAADAAPAKVVAEGSLAAPAGGGSADPATAEAAALRAELARSTAERDRLAEALRLARARPAAPETPAPDPQTEARGSGAGKGGAGLDLEIALRERDAARKQIESLMATAARLRAELDQVKAQAGHAAEAPVSAEEGPRAPPAADTTALRADLRAAVARLRELDPAFAAQLDQDLSTRQSPPDPGASAAGER